VIRVKLPNEKVWVLEPGDEITVGGETFKVEDVQEIEILEPLVSVHEGRVPGGGAQVRGLRLQDADTGIPVVVPMPLDVAKELGDRLAEDRVKIARSLPEVA
jgi:hypothetical protein